MHHPFRHSCSSRRTAHDTLCLKRASCSHAAGPASPKGKPRHGQRGLWRGSGPVAILRGGKKIWGAAGATLPAVPCSRAARMSSRCAGPILSPGPGGHAEKVYSDARKLQLSRGEDWNRRGSIRRERALIVCAISWERAAARGRKRRNATESKENDDAGETNDRESPT